MAMTGGPMSPGAARSLDKRVNAALNQRGARQERKRRRRPYIILIVVVLVVGPLLAALTPYYPNKFFMEYKENAYDPVTKSVNPESVKGMYYLGLFYYKTERVAKAMECWNTIGQWRLGVRITDWADNPRSRAREIEEKIALKRRNRVDPDALMPWRFDDDSLHWLGLTYYRVAEKLYDIDARTQPSGFLYARILAEGLDAPEIGIDEEVINRAKGRGRLLSPDTIGWDPEKYR